MLRRAVEWVFGSVVVYVLVAACATYGGGDIVAMATGGIMALVGGATPGGNPGVGGKAAGTGATSQGASGGISIVDPVPDANAAEDGTRIVNVYRTTADGLRTPEGYWDRELQVRCSFVVATDGKERCIPAVEGYSAYTFSDSACTKPVVSLSCSSPAPKSAVFVLELATPCGASTGTYVPYRPGGAISPSSLYTKTTADGECVAQALTQGMTYYAIGARFEPSELAEGAAIHE